MRRQTFKDILPEARQEIEEALSEKNLIIHLFEDATYFLEKAQKYERTNVLISRRYIRVAVISAFAGLEALVNTLCEIAADHPPPQEWGLPEQALVGESRVELSKEGYFRIRGKRIYSLEDKLKFFHWCLYGVPISDDKMVWTAFLQAKTFRNKIVHPSQRKISYSGQTIKAASVCVVAVLRVAQKLGWSDQANHKTPTK